VLKIEIHLRGSLSLSSPEITALSKAAVCWVSLERNGRDLRKQLLLTSYMLTLHLGVAGKGLSCYREGARRLP